MREKTEIQILNASLDLLRQGIKEFTGFQIANNIRTKEGKKFLIGYGALYNGLYSLENKGRLSSRWEEPPIDGIPRRRYYKLTEVEIIEKEGSANVS